MKRLLVCAATILGFTGAAQGQTPLVGASQDLVAPDAEAIDWFGVTALDDDVLVIGAPYDDSHGSVYVYRHDGTIWSFETKLQSPTPAPGDRFGESVDVCGSRVIVLSKFDDGLGTNLGAAFVFVDGAGGWSLEARLDYWDGKPQPILKAVALDGDIAVIHREYYDPMLMGGAVTFVRTGGVWSFRQALSDYNTIDGFAMQDGILVMGRRNVNLPYPFPGSASTYLWNGATWDHAGLLDAGVPDDTPDEFGVSVAIAAGRVAVGARYGYQQPQNGGAAYVFRRAPSAWIREAVLWPQDAQPSDHFGQEIALTGNGLVVYGEGSPGSAAGAAYVFDRCGTAWREQQKLVPSRGAESFPTHLAGDGATVILGSPQAKTAGGLRTGAAYVYATGMNHGSAFCPGDGSAVTCPCADATLAGSGCANSASGTGAMLTGFGAAAVSSDAHVLSVCGLATGSSVLFLQATQSTSAMPFGDGLLCLSGPIRRLGGGVAVGPRMDFPQGPAGLAAIGQVSAGTVAHYQVIYRDGSSPCASPAFNLSNGWTVPWGP